jgi:hypothetical protein
MEEMGLSIRLPRATTRMPRVFLATLVAAGLCLLLGCGGDDDGTALTTVSGDAIPFIGAPDGRIEGAEIWVLERPEMRTTTGADGHFELTDLPVGSEVTLVMDHPDYYPIQTGTIVLGPEGAERVTFQAVTYPVFDAFAAIVRVDPDETKCQMVTTVTRVGKSIYDTGAHGEADVVVTLDPPLPDSQGPIYFNSSVIPDFSLERTSDDGGVLFLQVPPGEYVWTATKPGVEFTHVLMKCRAGVLVNASPPWGLQALE